MPRTIMPSRNAPKADGFTLIEMMVVMAIVVVLAGLLLPALADVRKRARVTQCTNQLKNIAGALIQYDQEHDIRLENYPNRVTHLYPTYLSDPRIFICPADYTHATKDDRNGRGTSLKPFYKPNIPKDDKSDWAERSFIDPSEKNCSYLYEFSTRECSSWWKDTLVYWLDDWPYRWDELTEDEQLAFTQHVDRDWKADGTSIVTWQEAKMVQLENADVYVTGMAAPGEYGLPSYWSQGPLESYDWMTNYPRTMMPIVRCFWHCTPAWVDDADRYNGGPDEVLNLAIEGNTFFSVPGWEQTAWKYGKPPE